MAMTKTIQATVKNRTDTAANWTQKNPVLAEGEIIVVQTSEGETRLKIGDGVKTFTQLPYTDEQIYNNVVTSVNGQTGDVTLANDSKSLGLASATVGQIAKIAAVDASGVPTAWSPADMPSGGSSDLYVDFWPTGSEQYNGNFNGYQIELATDQTFDAIFDSFNAGNKIVARLYKDAEKSELAASSVDTAVTGTKEFGAIHFQFVTANADTGAIAGFPFIGEAIMMIKWEEAAVSYLIENRNVLPTPNADGTDNGKVPTINGNKWELKTPDAGGSPDAVLYTPQTLTDAQKKQARENIDAAIADFVVNGTIASGGTVTLNKTFGQIQAAIQEGKRPVIKVANNGSDLFMTLVVASEGSFVFASEALTFNKRVSVNKIELKPTGVANLVGTVMPTFNTDGQLRQCSMDAEPALDMQIATKKYVDDKISDKELILSSSTAGSTKKFKLTIDDTGTLTASEITA